MARAARSARRSLRRRAGSPPRRAAQDLGALVFADVHKYIKKNQEEEASGVVSAEEEHRHEEKVRRDLAGLLHVPASSRSVVRVKALMDQLVLMELHESALHG